VLPGGEVVLGEPLDGALGAVDGDDDEGAPGLALERVDDVGELVEELGVRGR
jgi:hypothetical protein